MSPLDVACPRCKAAVGFKCVLVINRRRIIDLETFHVQRRDLVSTSASSGTLRSPGLPTVPDTSGVPDAGAVESGPSLSVRVPPAADGDADELTGPLIPGSSAGSTAPSVMLICGHQASARESIRTLGTECYCELCDPPHWVKRQDRVG